MHVEGMDSADSRYTFALACYRSSFIRNSIIYDMFRIVGPDEKDYIQWNEAAITVQDLEYQTWPDVYRQRGDSPDEDGCGVGKEQTREISVGRSLARL